MCMSLDHRDNRTVSTSNSHRGQDRFSLEQPSNPILLQDPARYSGLVLAVFFSLEETPFGVVTFLFSEMFPSNPPSPVNVGYNMFMMKLYIWLSTTKWMGRHDRRSCVAGSHVSQERALYCSSTNLVRHTKEKKLLLNLELFDTLGFKIINNYNKFTKKFNLNKICKYINSMKTRSAGW